jgi:UDP-2-acetamido-2,6-beta-L-arabino-hexul-4-ose reductase
MRIVITGADGFIGRNLAVRLGELGYAPVIGITRQFSPESLRTALTGAGFVFHLAGVNRPIEPGEFLTGNAGFTADLCAALDAVACRAPVAFASSTQATLDNPYGLSKRAAEETLLAHGARHGVPVYLFRLTNVFGKWARPHYNSAVATFCHHLARGEEIRINDPASPLRLVYVDDVVAALIGLLAVPTPPGGFVLAGPEYETTVGELARLLRGFAESRASLMTAPTGAGLVRALWATYLSYLPPEAFAYRVPRHADPRGVFVEMLKTPDSGQFSFFTAYPGVTRGGHYHHTKTEKFLVAKGRARFRFRQIQTGETYIIETRGEEPTIVETIPGWTHDITNIGEDEMVVMLWANEIFDRERPDTVACTLEHPAMRDDHP